VLKITALLGEFWDGRQMRFCANVFMLFGEVPFLERFGRAAEAGFSAVEFW
jgi:hydroxypyruvate isomerase